MTPPLSHDEEIGEFKQLQRQFVDRWLCTPDIETRPRDVVVVPSLSLDGFQLARITAINHYEERMLFTLGLLRNPRARLVYVTSMPIQPAIVDYYLALIGGIPTAHARERLKLVACHDGTPRPLTEKILERPRVIRRIRDFIDPPRAHMSVFTVSPNERQLAVALGIPLYGVDPELLDFGTKSGSRRVFRDAGIPLPPGAENLRTAEEVTEAIADVWEAEPKAKRIAVKLNEGFSGEGNAILPLRGKLRAVRPGEATRKRRLSAIRSALDGSVRFNSPTESWQRFSQELRSIGGVVELYVEGKRKLSPSAQLRINPRGELDAMSTHDQLLGGADGQTYLGCWFPAARAYRAAIQSDALKVGRVLVKAGVIGRVAVDFVTVETRAGEWQHYAIEINLRMTGTTHPIMTLKLLNDGSYDPESGLYVTRRGEPRYYVSTDNLVAPHYRGLLPEDLLDIAAVHDLHYQPWKETGVVFHMLGALSQYGKAGMTCIGSSRAEANAFMSRAREAMDAETRD